MIGLDQCEIGIFGVFRKISPNLAVKWDTWRGLEPE